jgi:hypothetical protein
MNGAPGAIMRAFRAAKKSVPFLKMAIQNRHWIETAVKERQFLATKLSEKAAAEARLTAFRKEFDDFARRCSATGSRLAITWSDIHPCLDDRTTDTPIDRHYLYHPAWAARVLAGTRPERHVDVSSMVNFSAIVSAFIPVDFYDIRPALIRIDNLTSGAADLLNLPFDDNSIESLSCMHVIEHVGLGRYGEPIDPDGDLKAIRELTRVLAPGGTLLIAVPVGRSRIEFNAHRVYDHADFRGNFQSLELIEFALIRERAQGEGLLLNPPDELVRAESYGCGCYWFRKSRSASSPSDMRR